MENHGPSRILVFNHISSNDALSALVNCSIIRGLEAFGLESMDSRGMWTPVPVPKHHSVRKVGMEPKAVVGVLRKVVLRHLLVIVQSEKYYRN